MRIALLCCTNAEAERVRSVLGERHSLTRVREFQPQFDAAVIGTDGDRKEARDLAVRADMPAVLLLTSPGEYGTIGEGAAALAPGDLGALGHTIEREVRLQSGARALAERAWRDRELVRHIPGAVWTWMKTSGFVVLSDYIEEITGFSAGEFHAGGIEFWAGRIHPADISPLFDRWNELFEKREGSFEAEYRFLRKDATWAWLHERITIHHAESGTYVIGSTSDITARHAAEEALRNSELRYRTLVEQARDVIFSIDERGRITSLNRAFETMTGWKCSDWIGRRFTGVLERASAAAAIRQKNAPAGYREYRLRTHGGRSITIEAIAQRIEAGGEPLGTIGIARDVTRRKEIDAQISQDKRLASIGQLATSVAHDFNNVLMSIMPFAELIARRCPGDERVTKAARTIIEAVRRGREISQDVLRIARPSKPAIEPVGLAEWLDQFAPRAADMLGPTLRLDPRPVDREIAIAADRALLDQIATNLVVNAREAMDEGGTLTIAAREAAESVEIDFRDTGRGIGEAVIDHVFEPLFTTKRGRTGLGLSLAHQAMKQQEGAIRVRSRVGEGSTFTLSFRRAAPRVASEPRGAHGRKMLIVEDDEAVGEGLAAILQDEGVDTRLVATGLEAPPAIAEFGPDFVLLDVNLPDINGLDLYDRIHAQWPELSVIFSTGHADSHALHDLRQRSVPSIMKPYDIGELMSLIAAL